MRLARESGNETTSLQRTLPVGLTPLGRNVQLEVFFFTGLKTKCPDYTSLTTLDSSFRVPAFIVSAD